MCKTCNSCGIVDLEKNFPKSYVYKGEQKYRGICVSCEKRRKDLWRSQNKDKHNAKSRSWAIANPDKRKESCQKWYLANKSYQKEYKKNYKKNNKDRINASTSLRRKRVKQATPPWLTKDQKYSIMEIYINAGKNHVDHIVPLNGLVVCGLHVPWNLQILSPEDNLKKSNTWNE